MLLQKAQILSRRQRFTSNLIKGAYQRKTEQELVRAGFNSSAVGVIKILLQCRDYVNLSCFRAFIGVMLYY